MVTSFVIAALQEVSYLTSYLVFLFLSIKTYETQIYSVLQMPSRQDPACVLPISFSMYLYLVFGLTIPLFLVRNLMYLRMSFL